MIGKERWQMKENKKIGRKNTNIDILRASSCILKSNFYPDNSNLIHFSIFA